LNRDEEMERGLTPVRVASDQVLNPKFSSPIPESSPVLEFFLPLVVVEALPFTLEIEGSKEIDSERDRRGGEAGAGGEFGIVGHSGSSRSLGEATSLNEVPRFVVGDEEVLPNSRACSGD